MMITSTFKELYERDLSKLKNEIEQYSDSADIWVLAGDIPNSAGNLALHLVGNLNHFIGGVLGGSGYVRDRQKEFSETLVPREELIASIDETRQILADTFDKLTDAQLQEEYPIEVKDSKPITFAFLMHLLGHLGYHLGQINYHRRILAKQLKGE